MKNKKIIGVDLRCLPQDSSYGAGVAHAAREVCLQIFEFGNQSSEFGFRFYVPKGADWQKGNIVELPDATGKALRFALQKHPCDMLFVPGGSIAPAIKTSTIPWVHDLIIFEHPEWFNQPWWQRIITTYLFKKGLKNAPIIFAVSEYTKSKIVQLLKIDPGKIVVTHEGGDPLLSASDKIKAKEFCEKELGLGRKIVLCLGTIEPRKNIAMLIRAWKKAKDKSALSPDLVVAGANGWKYDDVEEEIKLLTAIEEQFFHRYRVVTDEQKRILLLGADLVCVPSLDEGFGLVALEAMQAGTPVAVSSVGALPEVVGEAGMLIDPQDEQTWATAMLTCVQDERACKLRSDLGFKQAEKFGWDKTAEIVYKTLSSSF